MMSFFSLDLLYNSNVAIGHSWHKKKHTVKNTIHIANENCKKTHDLEDDK